MATSNLGHFSVKGVSIPFAVFRTDFRVGRVDFSFRNLDKKAVAVNITESEVDGTLPALLAGDVVIQPGGVASVSINSAKGLVSLNSGSGNLNSAHVLVDANYLGATFWGGTLSLLENLPNTGFSGPNLTPGGVRD